MLATLTACVAIATPEPWPVDPDAQINPDAMFAAPAQVRPGEIASVSYADRWDRGILYAIEEARDGEWARLYLMISDANSGQPTWFRPSDPDVAVEAVGVAGVGPDRVVIPEVMQPGDYRICTANASDNLCTPIEILAP